MAHLSPSSDSQVVVTGASSGIGRQIAVELASRGFNLTLVARRLDRLEALADELGDRQKITVACIGCDLADASARADLIKSVLGADKRIVGLVNNAGFGSIGRFSEAPYERQLGQIQVNIEALVALTHGLVGPMLRQHEGAILNVASMAGFVPIPIMSVYAATKAFVISFSDALSAELHGSGVTVTCLCPNTTRETEFGQVAAQGTRPNSRIRLPRPVSQTATTVAQAGVSGMLAGHRTVIPGTMNKLTALLSRHSPRAAVLALMRRIPPETFASATRT